ncbi:hypothetical protein [Amycolatopsis orientalis]|uniref:hypothetical protein n=1 Tax=Amycolatopsis orientalis TaxID=31958 RepID=UPI000A84EA29|nr:hypothetical protein [Amycolatopsis orientalis]
MKARRSRTSSPTPSRGSPNELPVDAANSVDRLIRVKVTAQPSSIARTPDASHSRLGYVMTVSETGEARERACPTTVVAH